MRAAAARIATMIQTEVILMEKRKTYVEQMTSYLNDRIRELNKVRGKTGQGLASADSHVKTGQGRARTGEQMDRSLQPTHRRARAERKTYQDARCDRFWARQERVSPKVQTSWHA